MSRNYVGIACTMHDPALAIVNAQGEVVFAEAAEGSLQTKRALGHPPDEVTHIADLLEAHCDGDAHLVVASTRSGGLPWRIRMVTHGVLAT